MIKTFWGMFVYLTYELRGVIALACTAAHVTIKPKLPKITIHRGGNDQWSGISTLIIQLKQ